jgi:hypothetical protein
MDQLSAMQDDSCSLWCELYGKPRLLRDRRKNVKDRREFGVRRHVKKEGCRVIGRRRIDSHGRRAETNWIGYVGE